MARLTTGLLAALVLAGCAQSNDPAVTAQADRQELGDPKAYSEIDCEALAELAEGVMEARQAGIELSTVLKAAYPDIERPLEPLVRGVAVAAYESPRIGPDQRLEVDRSVRDFKNDNYLACIKAQG